MNRLRNYNAVPKLLPLHDFAQVTGNRVEFLPVLGKEQFLKILLGFKQIWERLRVLDVQIIVKKLLPN